MKDTLSLVREGGLWCVRFKAMAGPCEVFVDGAGQEMAARIGQTAFDEARRIEAKFSRYRDDNIVHRINHSRGAPIEVDEETAALLDYAAECYALSEGLFDVTSGVLREVWRFDGTDNLPSPAAVERVRGRIGWDKVQWRNPVLRLPVGMEIDFGGIGKEYAVDRTALLVRSHQDSGVLVNYGGDLYALGPRCDGWAWEVGVDDPQKTGKGSVGKLALRQGAVATSGDARRFLVKDGVRYGHILDPRTGWPVKDAPRSVTVTASSCMEAGILATLGMLHGSEAEAFLEAQEVPHWVVRGS